MLHVSKKHACIILYNIILYYNILYYIYYILYIIIYYIYNMDMEARHSAVTPRPQWGGGRRTVTDSDVGGD